MITLYGFAISNYYNKVKFTLLEKEIPFTEQVAPPNQEPETLEKSPVGKIPYIGLGDGRYLSESQAIVEYLEDAFPAKPLYPADAFQRAKSRELIQHLELNVELHARRLYGQVLANTPVSQETHDDVYAKLERGLTGFNRIFKPAPYALGENFSLGDVVAWPHLQLVGFVTEKVYGKNLVDAFVPSAAAFIDQVESRPAAKRVSADRAEALAQFFASKS